jgi:glycosyltransferase involved in cell wall biosynthesis
MFRTPLVSVIVPAHNAAPFIARTIASLRAQTFTDFEAIVVDDGSTDDTANVARAAMAGDPRLRLVRQANARVAAARNRGLAQARGRYVANLDADDIWRPQFLERTVEALEAAGEGATLAFARSLWIDADGAVLAGEAAGPPGPVDYRAILLRNPIGNGSAALMRHAAVSEAGGYDEGLVREFGQAEDWQLFLQVAARGRVIALDEPLVLYRISPQSTSHGLERAARASLEVIRRQRSRRPRLPRPDYWAARSLTLLWLARRALGLGRRGLALRFAAEAYLWNPLWFTLPELRAPVWGALRRLAGRRSRAARFDAQPFRS